MTRADTYVFLTSLLGGNQIDVDLFNTLLDIAQLNVEGLRPWVYTRAQDATQTISSGNLFTTAKTLASDFLSWYGESPLQLVDSNNNPTPLVEVPYAQRFQYKDGVGTFAVDYPNSNIYIMGTFSSAYTIYQNYNKITTLVSAAAGNSWVFPVRFHKILGLLVAVYWKLGVDYDIINNAQGNAQAEQAKSMIDIMTRWDSNLQKNMQVGIDPFSRGVGNQSPTSGRL